MTCLFVDLLWLASETDKVNKIFGVIGFLGGIETGLSCEYGITRCFVQSRGDPSLATMFFQFIKTNRVLLTLNRREK